MTKCEMAQIINDVELDVLTIIFATLKLCGVISWGWFYIFIPEIISLCVHIIIAFSKDR